MAPARLSSFFLIRSNILRSPSVQFSFSCPVINTHMSSMSPSVRNRSYLAMSAQSLSGVVTTCLPPSFKRNVSLTTIFSPHSSA